MRSLCERRVESIKHGQTRFCRATCGHGAKTQLSVELSNADRRQFFQQLVDADYAVRYELTQAGVRIIGQSNGEGAHGVRWS